jgi:hypothetical protein
LSTRATTLLTWLLCGLVAAVASAGLVTQSGPRLYTSSSSSSSSGGAADGATYSFTSPVSASAPPSKEFLGGSAGPIASGTNNTAFSRTGWTKLSNSTTADWYFSTVRSLNRSKSLLYDGAARGESTAPGGNARGTQQYDTGASGYKKLHRSTWYYWNWPHLDATNTQWKIQRWQHQTDHTGGGGPDVVDCYPPSAYVSSAQIHDNTPFSIFTENGTGPVTCDQAGLNTTSSQFVPRNAWFRLDTYMQENTPAGTGNGTYRIKVTEYATPSNTWTVTSTNRVWRGTLDVSDVYRYAIYQNYLGNSAELYGPWEESVIYIDDLYMGWVTSLSDTLYRVEMIDTNNIATATHPGVIQDITAASGTAWSVTLNAGHWSTVTGRYLVVIRCDDETVMGYVGPIASLQPAANDYYFDQDVRLAA